jgi:uracil-DNA glycosylase family 4
MSATSTLVFDPRCKDCSRLAAFLRQTARKYPAYHCAPVAPFGDPEARLLIVGLAPGMHGANATGRPFTGDYAGILLYRTLFEFGFSNGPESLSGDDGLELHDCRITNAVKCLPPQNKPLPAEIRQCNPYLGNELARLPRGAVILALGRIAHEAVVRALGLRSAAHRFEHGRVHHLADGRMLVDCYHCSRYNTQTRRLTGEMFTAVFQCVRELLDDGPAAVSMIARQR